MRQAGNGEESLGLHTEIVDRGRLVREPLVSVVMITYNQEPYIAQAIEGVVSQETDFPIELIIGEDCSTDRTREVVLEFQRQYPEMIRVLFSQKNIGMHKNFRRTMLVARGKYMAFCEGDDWWHRRDKLRLQISVFLADNSLVCLSGEIQRIAAHSQVMESEKQSNGTQPIRIEYQDLIFGPFYHPTCTVVATTQAVRRALLGGSLCNDETQLLGDLPLWLDLSQLGRMGQLRETLASYRETPNSASRRSDPLWARRFGLSMLDIRYRALEHYPLPGDATRTSGLKVYVIRETLPRAAWLGDGMVAKNQLRRLRSLGGKVGWKEMACVVLAFIPLPRRSLTVLWNRINGPLTRIGINPRKYFFRAPVLGPPFVKD